MSELYLIRHGQASFGTKNYDQLSEPGYEQSRLLGLYFRERNISFDHAIVGSMQRHHQTLDGINQGLAMEKPQSHRAHPGFNEYDFPALIKSFSRRYPDDDLVRLIAANPQDKKNYYRLLRRVLTAWAGDILADVPETWAAFQQRVAEARSMLHELAVKGNRVLVVSSGGAISQFIGSVLNLSAEKVFELNLQIHNTGICHFYFNAHTIRLAGFNGLPHLDRPECAGLVTYA